MPEPIATRVRWESADYIETTVRRAGMFAVRVPRRRTVSYQPAERNRHPWATNASTSNAWGTQSRICRRPSVRRWTGGFGWERGHWSVARHQNGRFWSGWPDSNRRPPDPQSFFDGFFNQSQRLSRVL